jgi:hypothetical protein
MGFKCSETGNRPNHSSFIAVLSQHLPNLLQFLSYLATLYQLYSTARDEKIIEDNNSELVRFWRPSQYKWDKTLKEDKIQFNLSYLTVNKPSWKLSTSSVYVLTTLRTYKWSPTLSCNYVLHGGKCKIKCLCAKFRPEPFHCLVSKSLPSYVYIHCNIDNHLPFTD